MAEDLSAVADYLAHEARRRPLLEADAIAARDATGFLRQLFDLTGGALPVLAGFRLGPSHPSAFEVKGWPCVAFGWLVALRPGPRGVEIQNAGNRALHAPSVESSLRRLVARDRVARAAYSFRVDGRRGAELAQLLECAPSAEWPGYYEGPLAVVDEALLYTHVDCRSLEGAARLLVAAETRRLPLILREDEPAERRPAPGASPSLTVTLGPRDTFGRPMARDGWDGPSFVRLEVRGDAIVQTRLAFGHPLDERFALPGSVGWSPSPSVNRALGSPRLEAWLRAHRAARIAELAQPDLTRRLLGERGLASFAVAAAVEERGGGVVGAGPWGGVEGIFIAPGLLLGAEKTISGPLPRELGGAPVEQLGDTSIDGLRCGWLNRYNVLYVDRGGRLYSTDDNGDEYPEADDAIALLEKLALEERVRARCKAAVIFAAPIAAALAAGLGVARVDEASDDVSAHFCSGEDDPTRPLVAIEQRNFPYPGRAPIETLVWAETPERLLAAARLARELAPDAKPSAGDSYITSSHRLRVLRDAGFETG